MDASASRGLLLSMGVLVVRVRHMRVAVAQGFMAVGMAVRPRRHGVMHVVVMSIMVVVGMIMFCRCVQVFMAMAFRQMQHNTTQHEEATYGHQHP